MEYSQLNPQAYDYRNGRDELIKRLVRNSKTCSASFLALKRLAEEWYESERKTPNDILVWHLKFLDKQISMPASDNRHVDIMRKIVINSFASELKSLGIPIHYRNEEKKNSASYILSEAARKSNTNIVITPNNVKDYYYELRNTLKTKKLPEED